MSAVIRLWGTWYEPRMDVRRAQSKRWSTVRGRSFLQEMSDEVGMSEASVSNLKASENNFLWTLG